MLFKFDQRMQLALMVGFFYCLIISIMGGWHEPWDTPIYWMPGLLITFILAAIMGWCFPSAPWQSGRDIAIGQFIAIFLIGLVRGNTWGLLPLALAFMVGLTIPLIVGNFIGAYTKVNVVKKNLP